MTTIAERRVGELMPASVVDERIVDLLRELVAGQHAIVAELRALRTATPLRRPSPLTRRDRARLERLLPAVAGVKGSEKFTVDDVITLPAVRVVVGRLTARHVGRLLRRAVGVAIDGLTVERTDEKELNRVLWRVVAVVG
jgi:hypothetical protein